MIENYFVKDIFVLQTEACYDLSSSQLSGTFRSHYDNDYKYGFFNVYPVRMRDCVRLSRQLVLSGKSCRELQDFKQILSSGYEFTAGAKVPCNLSRNVLWTCGILCCFSTKLYRD